ncbi:glycerophosphodiester phosphodiesterase [Acidobacteriota bacterium]
MNRFQWVVFLLIAVSLNFPSCREYAPPEITAHRGASAYTPENTLIAYQTAMDMGADRAELDVWLSKDGEVVLMHDEELLKTTGAEGMVWELTLDELKKLEAGAWFSEKFRGETIPTLREVIHLVRGEMKLNIEVKTSQPEPRIAQKVVDLVRSENFIDHCIVTSFDREVIEDVKRIAPEITTGFIFDEDYPEDVMKGNWDILSCSHEIATKAFVKETHRNGKRIHVWTINDEAQIRHFTRLNVDGIITDKPDLAKKLEKN